MQQIFTSATTGDSTVVEHAGDEIEFSVDGDFGGATVRLMCKPDGCPNFIPVSESGEPCEWVEPLIKRFDISRPCELKLTIIGTATSINAWA